MFKNIDPTNKSIKPYKVYKDFTLTHNHSASGYLVLRGANNDRNYFCMERWDIWEDLLGASPESIQELDFLFARSLSSRFHHNLAPQEKKYYHL